MADAEALRVLRALDKADRMPPLDIFDLLTAGREDPSGDVTPGCNLTSAQAAVLTGFVFSQRQPQIARRLHMIAALEDTVIRPFDCGLQVR